MIDYDFYVNTYLGTALGEAAFPEAAARAEQALESILRRYQLRREDGLSRKLALCAMAEELGKKRGVCAATVGQVSVRYDTGMSLERRLLEKAKIYLDIYRGSSLCSAP